MMLRLGLVAPGRSRNLLLLSTKMLQAQLPLTSSLHTRRAVTVIAPSVEVLDECFKSRELPRPLKLKAIASTDCYRLRNSTSSKWRLSIRTSTASLDCCAWYRPLRLVRLPRQRASTLVFQMEASMPLFRQTTLGPTILLLSNSVFLELLWL